MITRGIVVDTDHNGDKIQVRIPIIDGMPNTDGATADEDLSWASSVCFSGIRVNYEKGDVVVVGFEDNNIGIPIVLGHLNLVNREMPPKVAGNFTDLESGAFSVTGGNGQLSMFSVTGNGLSLGGINYSSLTESESSVVLYDRSSSSLNQGKTGGLQGGDTLSGLDLSPYNYLRVTYFGYDLNCIYFINLRTSDYREADNTYLGQPVADYRYGGGGTIIRPSKDPEPELYYSTSLVSADKKKFYHYQCGYTENGAYNIRNNNAMYYISKIEGIKQN